MGFLFFFFFFKKIFKKWEKKNIHIWDKSSASTFNECFDELCGIIGLEKLFGDFKIFHLHEQGEII